MLPIASSRPEPGLRAPVRVERIHDAGAFAAIRGEWNDLVRDSRADSVFLTWEWLHACWTAFGDGATLEVVLVRAAGDLIAAAPLQRTRTSLPWLTRLEFLGLGFAGSDYLDLIVRRGWEDEALPAIEAALERENRAVRFDHLASESTAAALADRLAAGGWTAMASPSGTCPFIPLRGHSWDSYLAVVGPAHRANFRRRLRTLSRDYELRFDRVTTEAEREESLRALIRLHNQRWDVRGGSTAFATPACRAFHDDATRRMLDAGWLRFYVLRLNDAVVAATYCFAFDGRVYFYQGAFDEDFRRHSVGMVAMGLTIQAAIAEGAREFDLLYGVESYKALWARDRRLLYRIDLFPADMAGRLHRHTVTAERAVRRLARRIIPRRTWNSNAPRAGAAC
jgi:CelD/BcsL family acetyltransferase involved in cellulose biosynthesis